MKRIIILVLVSVLFSCNDTEIEPWTLNNSKELAIEFCNDNKNRDFAWAKNSSFFTHRNKLDNESKLYYPLAIRIFIDNIHDERKSTGITIMPRYPYEEKELLESYNEYTCYFENGKFGDNLKLSDSVRDSLKVATLQTVLMCEKPDLEECYIRYFREYLDSCLSIEVSALILSALPDGMEYKKLNSGMEYLEFNLGRKEGIYGFYFFDKIRDENSFKEEKIPDVKLLDEHWGYRVNEKFYDSITKELITHE